MEGPFRSVYELEDGDDAIDPEAEETLEFLNELYDDEFNDALFELANESADLYEERFESEYGDSLVQKAQAMRMLEQHFAPLAQEAETFLDSLAGEIDQLDPNRAGESELEAFVESYEPKSSLSPEFENFLGGLMKKAKKWAKKGLKVVGKLGLKQIINRSKKLLKPLLKKVLEMAINKLPLHLHFPAKELAKKVLKTEVNEAEFELEDATPDISGIQREFDEQMANLLFAREAVEQEVAIAEYVRKAEQPLSYDPLSDLDRARSQFVRQLGELQDGEDPTPLVENFIPAILPVLKAGISLIGRSKVVNYLAKYLAKLIRKLIGPQYAPALSQAIVDVGLRLINLEATPEDEALAARTAVAATIEDTVRQVAALPEYVLDNQELLEGFIMEAFEQSATANLPPILPERVYETRPDLRETTGPKGTWVLQPLRGKKQYKKCTRIYETVLTPHVVQVVKTYCDIPLVEFLQDRLGLLPGRPVKARVHLYEAIPGTRMSQICKAERYVSGLGQRSAWTNLHPLTPVAAGMLLGQPGLGREVPSAYLDHDPITAVGQRLYYLEIPEARPQLISASGQIPKARRVRQLHVKWDFPQDQIQINLFLSEAVAQAIATKLRQEAPLGSVMAQVQAIMEPRLTKILSGKHHHHLRIIHGRVTPSKSRGRILRSLPSTVRESLSKKLIEWVGQGLSTYFQQKPQDFIAATENPADGVTLKIVMIHPPGFAGLRKALRGDMTNGQELLQELQTMKDQPTVNIQVMPGFSHD
ncbi:hypothetical protein IQ254_07060 [Nodosilinea sp. LEGE 07088]|uniref:hypothetical protein n=1 Tax=Nodosilinea sp. LEGE 07088 TaxID=2777968 RepID=UPI0018808E27|nr:hypothetical protein [Nodosilinea sp. LEGE 07088]MBE9136962.1 hypothetical protein [Nodosilinea sp. LEGE 07088]